MTKATELKVPNVILKNAHTSSVILKNAHTSNVILQNAHTCAAPPLYEPPPFPEGI
jgi:hypothetical protein